MDLPPRLKQIYDALDGQGEVDIDQLYRLVFDKDPPKNVYEHLGIYFTRLNRRLAAHKRRVIPGRRKRTYCLTTTR